MFRTPNPSPSSAQFLQPGVSVGLALLVTLAGLPTAPVEAQVRANPTRQLRAVDSSPCGAELCLHHIELDETAYPVRTGVSGHDIGRTRVLSGTGQASVISSFRLGERSDEPCFVELEWAGPTQRWDACGGNGPTTVKSAGPNSNQVVVGLRVCHNNRNDERGRLVKGVRLEYAHRPWEASTTDRGLYEDRITQPNCRTWQPWVRCPVGMAAHTVIVHHVPIGGRRGAVGLQLNCLPAEPLCFEHDDPVWDANPPEAACTGDDQDD